MSTKAKIQRGTDRRWENFHYKMTSNKSMGPNTCSKCFEEFKSYYSLNRHLRSVHKIDSKGNSTLKSPTKVNIEEPSQMDAHVASFEMNPELKCHMCAKVFKSPIFLRNHIRDIHTCPKCQDEFRSKYLLQKHYKSCLETEGNQGYRCTMCPQVLHTHEAYMQHFKEHMSVYESPDEGPTGMSERSQMYNNETTGQTDPLNDAEDTVTTRSGRKVKKRRYDDTLDEVNKGKDGNVSSQDKDQSVAEEDPLNTGEVGQEVTEDEPLLPPAMNHAVTCLWLDPQQPNPNICATLLPSLREVHAHIVGDHVSVTSYHDNGDHGDEQACYWNGCARYGRLFRTRPELEHHLQEHTGANEKFPCTIDGCDEAFERSRDLWNHKWMHKRERTTMETIDLKYSSCSVGESPGKTERNQTLVNNRVKQIEASSDHCSAPGPPIKTVVMSEGLQMEVNPTPPLTNSLPEETVETTETEESSEFQINSSTTDTPVAISETSPQVFKKTEEACRMPESSQMESTPEQTDPLIDEEDTFTTRSGRKVKKRPYDDIMDEVNKARDGKEAKGKLTMEDLEDDDVADEDFRPPKGRDECSSEDEECWQQGERRSKKSRMLDKYQNSDWTNCSGKSEAWQYFQTTKGENGEKLVRCVKCLNIYEHISTSTSHLRRHLIKVHKIELSDKCASTQGVPSFTPLQMKSVKDITPGTVSQVPDSKRQKMLKESKDSEWVRHSNMNSEVWKHFELKTGNNGKRWVRCVTCKKISEWKDASTNNLRYHLMNKHQIKIADKTAVTPKTSSALSDFAMSIFDESTKKTSGTVSGSGQGEVVETDVPMQDLDDDYLADGVSDSQPLMKISSVYSEAKEGHNISFKCSKCPDEFQSSFLLKQHLEAAHIFETMNLSSRSPSLTKNRYEMLRESQNSEWVRCPNMTSEVWKYFKLKVEDDGRKLLRCVKCLQILNRNNTRTYNLWNHLRNVHQIVPSEKTWKSKMKEASSLPLTSVSNASYAEELSKTAADLTAQSHKLATRETKKNLPKNCIPLSKKNLDVWKYFKIRAGKNGKELVKCEICAKASPLSNVSTSNLWGHLYKAHSDRFSQNDGPSEAESAIEWHNSESINPSNMNLSRDPKVWKYFELRLCRSGKKLARCDMCAKIFECPASSTSDLRRHLLAAHQINLSEMEAPMESSIEVPLASDGNDVDGENKDGKSVDGENNDGKSVDGENNDGKSVDGEPKDGKLDSEPKDGNVGGEEDGKPTKSWLKSAQSMFKRYNKTSRVAEMAGKLEEGDKSVTNEEIQQSLVRITKFLMGNKDGNVEMMSFEKILEYLESKGHLNLNITDPKMNTTMPNWMKLADGMCKKYGRRFRMAELAGGIPESEEQTVTPAEVWEGITRVGKVLTRDEEEGCYQQIMALEKIVQYVDSKTKL